MLSLWCGNALLHSDLTERVGIVCRAESEEEARLLFVQAHPDKYVLGVLAWCPVWLAEYYAVWARWHHLRGHASLLLQAFDGSPFPCFDSSVVLNVPLFNSQYDPFLLSQWIWGVRVRRFGLLQARVNAQNILDVEKKLRRPVTYTWMAKQTHAERIAYLAMRPARDPVQIIPYEVKLNPEITSSWIIGDGTHRYAAALVRGDSEIAAVTTAQCAEELIRNGMARVN